MTRELAGKWVRAGIDQIAGDSSFCNKVLSGDKSAVTKTRRSRDFVDSGRIGLSGQPSRFVFVHLALIAAFAAPTAFAEVPKPERKAIKKQMASYGTLYLRTDAPCQTGRHPYGIYRSPVVEVSPEGVNLDGETTENYNWWTSDSTFWGIRINDPVRIEGFDFDEDQVEIELEGVGPIEDEATVVLFVGINSKADFDAAFANTFSTVPLQEEEGDWSVEMKSAVAKRELVEGMSKRQAYYVTGKPVSFDKYERDGIKYEEWKLRQSKGRETGFWMSRSGEQTKLPSRIVFEDGKLAEIGSGGADGGLDLDD